MKEHKSLERLIIYRLLLENEYQDGMRHIFSHQIAEKTGNSAAQIRRDLMQVKVNGNAKNGYEIKELIDAIKAISEPKNGISFVVVGAGNLGRAILNYFSKLFPQFIAIACFDIDPEKINHMICGVYCYPLDQFSKVVSTKTVQIGIIAVPPQGAQVVATEMANSGIKGIVNFSSTPIKAPKDVFIENMDIRIIFEKAAYFARNSKNAKKRMKQSEISNG